MSSSIRTPECVATEIVDIQRKSYRELKKAEQAKRRLEKVNATGRNETEPRYAHVDGFVLASDKWAKSTCAERVVLLAVLSLYAGFNNGRIRAGVRKIAEETGLSNATVARAFLALCERGLLVLTNAPTRGEKAATESEWLLPFKKDNRKGAQPTPLTAFWNRAKQDSIVIINGKQHVPFAMLNHDVMASEAWKALKPPARVLLVGLIYQSKRKNDIAVSNSVAGAIIGAGPDAGRRALNDLERHGFLLRHVQGQSLAGGRITATYSLDQFYRQSGDENPRKRYAKWKPGHDFEVPVSPANVRRQKATIVEPAAEPDAPIAAQPPPEVPAPTIAEPTPAPTDIEEDIDMTDPRLASHIIKGLHYATLDRFGKPFPMDEDRAQLAICSAADAVGPVNAVASFRAIALAAIANAPTFKDIAPAITASIRALRPAKATKRGTVAAAVGM